MGMCRVLGEGRPLSVHLQVKRARGVASVGGGDGAHCIARLVDALFCIWKADPVGFELTM